VIPLRDRNPTRRTPVVTYSLIGLCVAAFAGELLITAVNGDAGLERFFEHWGAVPADITSALESGNYFGQATLGMLTSMFLHGSWLHVLGNMLFLWIFGNNVEDRIGRIPFLLFYLVGGIAAALSQVVIDPHSTVPLVGASGAIAAALGAYIVLFPRARILSLVSGFTALGAETANGSVAFFAHIGGFALGVVVGLILRVVGAGSARREPPLNPAPGPMG